MASKDEHGCRGYRAFLDAKWQWSPCHLIFFMSFSNHSITLWSTTNNMFIPCVNNVTRTDVIKNTFNHIKLPVCQRCRHFETWNRHLGRSVWHSRSCFYKLVMGDGNDPLFYVALDTCVSRQPRVSAIRASIIIIKFYLISWFHMYILIE